MEDIKEAVGKALEKKGVLSKLRAELRANVFFAIDEQGQNNGGEGLSQKTNTSQRQSLIDTPEGLQLFGLVHDFLLCASLDFTTQVYEAEAGLPDGFLDRSQLSAQLKLQDAPSGKPLLLSLLKRGPPTGGHAADSGARPAPSSAGGGAGALPPPAARPKLTPLAPVEAPKSQAATAASQPSAPAATAAAASKAPPPIVQAQAKPAATAAAAAPASTSLKDLPSIGGAKPAAPPARAPPPPAAPPPPTVMPEPSSNTSYGDDADDFEMEEEIPENNSEGADEDEDYASYFGGGPPPASQAPNVPTSPKDGELSDSNLSNSGATSPGRIRKSKLSVPGKAAVPEDLPNDRSFGVSAELGGYDARPPPPRVAKESSGGLSFSGELPRSMEIDSRLSTLPPKPMTSLAPLGAPKGLSANKLALAPIGSLKPALAPLTSSKEDPLSKGRGLRQSSEDIRDDLRRSGLISSDSIGGGSASQSMEIPDMPPLPSHHHHPFPSSSSAGGGSGGASSARPGASHVYDEELSVSNSMMDIASEQEAALPSLAQIPGGLKTAAPGFGRISEVSTLAEDEVSRGSLYGPTSVSRGSLGGRGAVSLDFRDTGLSADDNSGELDKLIMGADMNETAEWVS